MKDDKTGAEAGPCGEGNPAEPGRAEAGPDPGQLAESLRFSLGTLLGIADKIKEAEPLRQPRRSEPVPDNLLAPEYRRPWWRYLAGLGGLYLGYRLLQPKEKPGSG